MHYGKQRATLALLFLLLPLVTALAFLQTPYVSDLVLQFTLKVVRFRTGIKIDAKSWSVRPITFSAALEGINVSLDGFQVNSPELTVQVSPISLGIGRLHISRVALKSPVLQGTIPAEWIRAKGERPAQGSIFSRNLPKMVGESLSALIEQGRLHHLTFEKIQLNNLKSELKGYRLDQGTIEIENLEGGQARVDWNLKGLKVDNQLAEIDASSLSVALIKNDKAEYFLVMPLFTVQPKGRTESMIQANGRWPGDMRVTAIFDLGDMLSWINGSPLIGTTGIKHSGGQIGFEGNVTLSRNKVDKISGELKGSEIKIDEYLIQSIDASFRSKESGLAFDRLNLGLPFGQGDRPQWKNILSSNSLSIDSKKITGEMNFHEVGLCSILRATDSPQCVVSFPITGSVKMDAQLSPFVLNLKPELTLEDAIVDSDPIKSRENREHEIVALHTAKLLGDILIDAKAITFNRTQLKWPDESQLSVEGKIQYSPTLVDLSVDSHNSRFASMFTRFLDLTLQGTANLNAKIFYSEAIPREVGQTRVLGRLAVDDVGVQSQNFGSVTGPINYASRTLRIGPLKLANGGGKATVDGTLTTTPKGGFFNLGAVADRLEVAGILPESKSEAFRGFVTGTATLRGYTNPKSSESLSGPIDLRLDTFRAFGVPFQRGSIKARYRNQILDLLQVVGTKDQASFRLKGSLNPNGGTELKFDSDDFKIKDLTLDPNLDNLQSGLVNINGFWRPAEGWAIEGGIKRLRIAGAALPDGQIKMGGSKNDFLVSAHLGDLVDMDMKTTSSGSEASHLEKLQCHLKDEALYAAFAYLKGWTSAMPVKTLGEINLNYGVRSGSVELKDLHISGPEGANATVAKFIEAPGIHTFAWLDKKITKNTMSLKGQSSLSLEEDGEDVNFRLELPLALLDLVVPNLKFIEGRLKLNGQIPLPPDITTVQAQGTIDHGTLFIRGVGQPIQNLNSNVSFSKQQIGITSAKGNLGGGDVSLEGVYKVDLKKPGANLQIGLNRAHVVIMDDVPADITGDLILKGEELPYLLAGRVQVSNVIYSKEFKQDPPIVSPNLKPILRFGLDVEYGTAVAVKNSMASVLVGGRMVVGGNDLLPDVQGKVSIISGSIYANETDFKVIQGLVIFPGGAAMPQINLQANTVIKNNNQDYKIELRVKGSADLPSIEFSSDPALSNSDIINLLAFGVIRPASDSGSSGDVSGAARIEMMQALFGRAIGKSLDRSTGLQVRFKSAQNAQSGAYVPKVTVVKKLSERMTLTVGRNLDVTSPEDNYQVDYKLFNNVNLTGVVQKNGDQSQETSKGVDLRFRFEVK